MERVRFLFVISSLLLFVHPEQPVTGSVLVKPRKEVEATCGQNEIYSICDADLRCVKSCDNIDIWESTPCVRRKKCISGCVCEQGYVRDNDEGICVWENSCPRVRH